HPLGHRLGLLHAGGEGKRHQRCHQAGGGPPNATLHQALRAATSRHVGSGDARSCSKVHRSVISVTASAPATALPSPPIVTFTWSETKRTVTSAMLPRKSAASMVDEPMARISVCWVSPAASPA